MQDLAFLGDSFFDPVEKIENRKLESIAYIMSCN